MARLARFPTDAFWLAILANEVAEPTDFMVDCELDLDSPFLTIFASSHPF